jgi:hypothetical protein
LLGQEPTEELLPDMLILLAGDLDKPAICSVTVFSWRNASSTGARSFSKLHCGVATPTYCCDAANSLATCSFSASVNSPIWGAPVGYLTRSA